MKGHEEDKQEYETRLPEVWKGELAIPYKYTSKRDEFHQFISKLEDLRDGRLGCIKTAKHQIEWTSIDIRPVQSTS